jgi:hypothetical protein
MDHPMDELRGLMVSLQQLLHRHQAPPHWGSHMAELARSMGEAEDLKEARGILWDARDYLEARRDEFPPGDMMAEFQAISEEV